MKDKKRVNTEFFVVFFVSLLLFLSFSFVPTATPVREHQNISENTSSDIKTRENTTFADNITLEVTAPKLVWQLLPLKPYVFEAMYVVQIFNHNNQTLHGYTSEIIKSGNSTIYTHDERDIGLVTDLAPHGSLPIIITARGALFTNGHLFGPFTVKYEVFVIEDNSTCSVTFDGFACYPVVWYTSDNVEYVGPFPE